MAAPKPAPAAPGKAPRARKAAGKTAAKKKSSGPKKHGGKRKAATLHISEPSDTEISLRAYFIAERRLQLALQGDPANDWIEARKQLLAEARQART